MAEEQIEELSHLIEQIRMQLGGIRNTIEDLDRFHPRWRHRIVDITSLLTCGIESLCRMRLDVIEWEIKRDDSNDGPSLHFSPRGIGMDTVNRCFVCGDYRHAPYMHNLSGFVKSQEEGQQIVDWFGGLAKLDYSPSEPNHIQVKVGVCEEHRPNLDVLYALTRVHSRIRQSMILRITQAESAPEEPIANG